MTGKRAENVLEIYIGPIWDVYRSLLGLRSKDIHQEVCAIYGDGQMSFSTICRWVAKFKYGQQQLKDAARPGRPVTSTTTKKRRKNPGDPES